MTSLILPEEIVEYIISFTCDRRGYNMFLYKHRIKEKWCQMRRITDEMDYFHHLRYSIAWLRPSGLQKKQTPEFIESLKKGKPQVTYNTGCYNCIVQERSARHLVYMNKSSCVGPPIIKLI